MTTHTAPSPASTAATLRIEAARWLRYAMANDPRITTHGVTVEHAFEMVKKLRDAADYIEANG